MENRIVQQTTQLREKNTQTVGLIRKVIKFDQNTLKTFLN